MNINFMKENNLELELNVEDKESYTEKITFGDLKTPDTIVRLQDELNYDFYFKKYWNSFANSDTPKINFTLDEFLEQMENEEYLSLAINKMEFQKRTISCQYIKEDSFDNGFANYFLMHLPKGHDLCCGSDYYFIYINQLKEIEDATKELFLPRRKTYKKLAIDPDSLDYLANFAVPMNENDRIYCLKCKKLIKKGELFGDDKVLSIN